jgi:hypothetical protein
MISALLQWVPQAETAIENMPIPGNFSPKEAENSEISQAG